MSFRVVNPATGAVVGERDGHGPAEQRRIVRSSGAAAPRWRAMSFEQRAGILRAAAAILRRDAGQLAVTMATEMGKPVTQGRAEAEKCAWVCEFYADNGAAFLSDRPVEIGSGEAFVTFRPLGAVFAVMPWNFPLWQVFRAAAPALMAGNVMLLKHASNVPDSAVALERIWREAGAPPGIFSTLLIDGTAARRIIRSDAVQAVTLTGSTAAGRAVARDAGSRLKKTVLELGGSDPYLILHDADLELAAETCARSRLVNSGQSCIAAKRFIVVDAVRDEFERLFTEQMRAARSGDPMDPATEVGPMARTDLRDELHAQVMASVSKGARLLLGGVVPEQAGAWYPPTVLTDVRRGMPAWNEELFGPVASIIPVRNEEAAIRAANATRFGLGSAVFTRDLERGRRIARERLDAGFAAVNRMVVSDPRLPFGGIGDSGHGRELSAEGIREFVNVKSVVVS
ncbi:MAG TPA: NAD-dependent succinate-semialdehyde dehydrogenase [Gemmatimonadales bacterium]|nr:NAD-dependent succinate-semialdehyde dehydrogenase [Gemmatimonadales bacterium]